MMRRFWSWYYLQRLSWLALVTPPEVMAKGMRLGAIEATGALDATRQDALSWAQSARAALDALPGGEVHDLLGSLTDYVVDRIV